MQSVPRESPSLSRGGGLPREYSSFVDRREPLAAARTALGETRLLSLVGPGGVGKTRFAIRLAEMARKSFEGGEWYIDLTRVSATGSVSDEIARVLEIPSVHDVGDEDIARFFGDKHGLLVLDNCEHVIEQCTALVVFLLRSCRELSILTTSRIELRLSAERVFRIEPFETFSASSPAARLFLERCAAALPDPTAGDRRAVDEICRRLDGLPLAIELAAARVKALTPTQILERLARPLDLLTTRSRDVPDRQRTLLAAIEWSYELCTPAERAVWRRMSVFVGEWDLDAAEFMCRDDLGGASVLDVVQELTEKSIVSRVSVSGSIYFGLLDTLRNYGLHISTPDDLVQNRERLREWLFDRLQALEAEWYGPAQAQWLAFTYRALPNIRSALEFCLESKDVSWAAKLTISAFRIVWQANGLIGEFLDIWCKQAIDLGPAALPEYCELLCIYASWKGALGEIELADRYFQMATELAEEIDDPVTQHGIVDRRASRMATGDKQEWARAMEAALASQGGRNINQTRSNLAERVASANDLAGNVERAEQMRRVLIAQGIAAGESYETALLLLNAGIYAMWRHEPERATELLRQSLSLAQNLGSPPAMRRAQEALAAAAIESQDFVRAATLLGLTLQDDDAAGALWGTVPTLGPIRVQAVAHAREALGERAYNAAIAAGRAMAATDGIAYALGTELPKPSSRSRSAQVSLLTAREGQVAALVGEGLTDKEIAARLVISSRTAEGHVANSLMKLGFTSRAQLAAWTRRDGAD